MPLALASAGEPVLAGILAVGAMTVLTGALHLDGLADTADALLAPDRATAERARKDPAVGPGGAVALILVLGIEVAALASLASSAGPWSRAPPSSSRRSSGARCRSSPSCSRRRGSRRAGSAAGSRRGSGGRDAVVAVVIAVVVTAGLAVATGRRHSPSGARRVRRSGSLVAAAIVRGRRQLDGDGMGAIIELTVAAAAWSSRPSTR